MISGENSKRQLKTCGMGEDVNPVNSVIAYIKKMRKKLDMLTEGLWVAVGEFMKRRRKKGKDGNFSLELFVGIDLEMGYFTLRR
jgi:hypothetical protein